MNWKLKSNNDCLKKVLILIFCTVSFNTKAQQSEINIRVSDKAPKTYFDELKEQATNGGLKYGGIQSMKDLLKNLDFNCIPHNIFDLDYARL